MAIKKITKQTILNVLVFVLILNASPVIGAQTPVNFAGTWVIDHSKSDAEFRDYQITCIIEQSAAAITVTQELVMKDGQKSSMPPVTFNLQGNELPEEGQGGANNISAVLSPDRKTLTTKMVRTMDGNEFGSIIIYSLSEDANTLTITSSDLNSESPMTQVYNRK